MPVKLNILIAPLDWGLGHATRCLPIIDYLLQKGHKVTLAAEGAGALLLERNFPELELIPLRGYRIQYSNRKKLFTAKIFFQIPKILNAIRSEHTWLKQVLQTRHFDLLISDNRYGLYHRNIPSVIMTHQLQVKTGIATATDRILQRWHYRFLEKFTECWIVDKPAPDGLAGDLSHPWELPRNARYIGLLSQLTRYDLPETRTKKTGAKHILVLLSGPEPMRNILEQKILRQIGQMSNYLFTFVAGKPLGHIPENLPPEIVYYSHLHGKELYMALQQADLVICRSGYSTLMDLAWMGKKAVLIPTPGQTEQEYLARLLMQKKIVCVQKQDELDLATALPQAFAYDGFPPEHRPAHQLMKNVLDQALVQNFPVDT